MGPLDLFQASRQVYSCLNAGVFALKHHSLEMEYMPGPFHAQSAMQLPVLYLQHRDTFLYIYLTCFQSQCVHENLSIIFALIPFRLLWTGL